MPHVRWFATICVAVLISMAPRPAQAQGPIELGASLLNVTFVVDDEVSTIIGAPAGGLGILNPGVYASFRIGSRFAVEPQVGFMLVVSDGETDHILNTAVQGAYFFSGLERRSVFVFGGAGFLSASGDSYTPKTFGGGVGYRMPMGDRLVLRLDGRYTRMTADFGDDTDLIMVTVSLGGLFGK